MKTVESQSKKSPEMLVVLSGFPSPRPEGRRFFRRKNRPELIPVPQGHSTFLPPWDTSFGSDEKGFHSKTFSLSGSFEESQPPRAIEDPRLKTIVEDSRPSFLDRPHAAQQPLHGVFILDELRVSVESFNASEVNFGFSFASLTSFPTLGVGSHFIQKEPQNLVNQDSKIEPHFAFWLGDSPKKGILRVSGTLRN